jgi:hypothetical protein
MEMSTAIVYATPPPPPPTQTGTLNFLPLLLPDYLAHGGAACEEDIVEPLLKQARCLCHTTQNNLTQMMRGQLFYCFNLKNKG